MKFLFVKDALAFPRSSGHDVHSFYLMRALAGMGHSVSLATRKPVEPAAIAGGSLASTHVLTGQGFDGVPLKLTKMQEKFRSYWGVPEGIIREIGQLSRDLKADVVSVVGLNVLPYLGAVQDARRVWYAGDEWFWHHASQVRLMKRASWGEMKQAVFKGLYERVYSRMMDRVWMVSSTDKNALKWVAGHRGTDVLPNGIDSELYSPGTEIQTPKSCVFWGRLDFGPNIQALEWFCRNVWPDVRKQSPDATFSVFGFQPTPPVEKLVKETPGVTLTGNMPDIRSSIRSHEIVVLPFVSGGGIKNKLLEAAAMGQAVVCTPRTVAGLAAGTSVVQQAKPAGMAREIVGLFGDAPRRAALGKQAREWVLEHHTWDACARTALDGLK